MKICPKCGTEYENANTLCPADGTVLQKEGDDLIGQTLAGKYRIDERLDEGGMGTVYRATHVLMEKLVAIKVLHPALAADEKIVQRFTREAKAASRIYHPHALTVTDFGESENGIVFLVMEYLRGRTLKDVIRSDGPLPLPRAAEIIRQVCGALEAAHAEGVVHRDLKSDNIMLEEVGADKGDWAKVLDFGIAKIKESTGEIDPGLTAPNLIIGTPQYMSPEQCSQASEIDSRSDLYSLGIILYEMLVSHVPFTGDSPTGIMLKHLQEAPPSILEERQDLPPALARVVARALAKRPEDRFQTAGEFREAVSLAVLGDEGASASAAAAVVAAPSIEHTSRMVIPTSEHDAPRDTLNEDDDEATVVRARATATQFETAVARSAVAPPPSPPSPASFNPWRIAVPALALLAVIFAVAFVFFNGQTAPPDGEAPLAVDPNGQPALSASPATGESERNIMPGTFNPAVPSQTTTSTTSENANVNANANANRNANSEVETLPTPAVVSNSNTNENTGAEANPTSTPPANTNQRRVQPPVLGTPTPDGAADDDDAPPVPTPKEKPKEKPASTPLPPGR